MSAPTSEQIETLLNFLEENRELARGLLRTVEGRLQSQRLWGEISTTLNAMGGCTKTVQQWQRVWTDRKYLSKKNIAAARRSANATGGGPSTAPQLSQWDLKVLTIMGDGFGEPQTTARVPAFVEQESLPPSMPLTPYTLNEPVESQVISELLVTNEPLEPTGSMPVQTATSTEHLPTATPRQRCNPKEQNITTCKDSTVNSTTTFIKLSDYLHLNFNIKRQIITCCATNTRRERRRTSSTDDSTRSRFFRLEQERLALHTRWTEEFVGIRAALTQLNNMVQGALTEFCVILREISQQPSSTISPH